MDMNVSQLLRESTGSTRDYEIDGFINILGESRQENPVKGKCNLLRTPGSILVQCAVKTEVELSCNRCLGLFRQPLNVKFTEEFFPTIDIDSGGLLPLPEESSSFTIDDQHTLDLTDAVRQYALLAIPMKPLCKKDCAGLCPTCGKNLNLGKCDCPNDDIDPRWSKLANLR